VSRGRARRIGQAARLATALEDAAVRAVARRDLEARILDWTGTSGTPREVDPVAVRLAALVRAERPRTDPGDRLKAQILDGVARLDGYACHADRLADG
jgi:glycosyltransferase A (GT-A) superfamily protein (DUF2064 family)